MTTALLRLHLVVWVLLVLLCRSCTLFLAALELLEWVVLSSGEPCCWQGAWRGGYVVASLVRFLGQLVRMVPGIRHCCQEVPVCMCMRACVPCSA